MALEQYVALANITLTSALSEVSFSSIPGVYRDLIVVANGKFTDTNHLVRFRLNSDSGANYSLIYFNAVPAVESSSGGNDWICGRWDSTEGMTTINVMDYSATDKHKTSLVRHGSASYSAVQMNAGRWASTSAVTAVSVFSSTGTFATGSTFTLYGVR